MAAPAFAPAGEQVVLKDGSAVVIRPIRRDDARRLRSMFYRLSPQTVYMRFLSPVRRPREGTLRYLSDLDHWNRHAVVAVSGDEVVGVARFERPSGSDRAEVAVLVEDAWQGRGLGRILLRRLASGARARGITAFTASMLSENRRAVALSASVPGTAFTRDGSESIAVIPL